MEWAFFFFQPHQDAERTQVGAQIKKIFWCNLAGHDDLFHAA